MRAVLIGLLALCWLSMTPAAAQAQSRAEKVRAEVREILSSPEFRVTPPEPSYFDRALKRIGELIDELFERIGRLFGLRGGHAGGNIAFWIILIGLIIGMGLLATYALRRLETRKTVKAPEATKVEEDPDSSQPEDWLALAQSFAARGDFRRAYRAMFRALLLRLDSGGLIRFDPSRTNGEYVRSLRSNERIYRIFRPAADGFDILWYGRRPAVEQDFQSCRTAYESVDSALA